ncbi:MAG: TIGR00266 family protein [Clostridium sp. 26_21]|nr:MAG: TIGR00266 family protein [Clostridium sp. 26_21]
MDYKIIGETVPVVEIRLKAGETVYTQSGGMAYQSDGISMSTNARGGIMQSLGRMFTGESIFMANYTAQKEGAMVAFASTVPGGIIDLDLATLQGGMIIQKGAFLCAEANVETSIAFTKKFSAGLFGGEGFILQKATGNGKIFLEVDGDVIQKELAAGEVLKVNTGNVVAFEPSVSYGIETIKGLGNIFLGGEGLFLTKLVGPGKVILQSQNFRDFAGRLIPYMPKTNND